MNKDNKSSYLYRRYERVYFDDKSISMLSVAMLQECYVKSLATNSDDYM